ncbi:PQQ-dependent sugar dehydrogenase [Haloplanus halophilus]|uniref:PQQ-dependent sugar dehydrogenase n=1 Tax=Haloplanus halophilus TaxID=2949993 RepID=UPI00203B3C54|nr:PQQ-dependent sugar dehydrogenase [Haloplanus sp. GDY1]
MAADRRRFLRRAGLALLGGLAGCGGRGASDGASPSSTAVTTGRAPTADPDRPGVGTELVAEGFTAPTDVVAPAGTDRLLVADQPGQVYPGDATTPLLDLSDRLVALRSGPDERGLLGLALHPDFPADRRLFVRYSAPPRESAPPGYSHTFVLSAFPVDLDRGSVGSERVVLEIDQPQPNHNAGAVGFGPDGYLYVGVGDGGGGGDVGRGHAADWYERTRGGNGQDVTSNLLGSVLRIDVDGDAPYAVPEGNPLVGRDGLDEQWAWGFRNPWRFSVDGDALLVADVGEGRYEEVNRVERGGNYGWNVREGTGCFDPSAPSEPPAGCPGHTLSGAQLHDPVVEYPHPGVGDGDGPTGVAVVGGYRYRGGVDALDGRYVFADWRAEGRLFLADPRGADRWPLSTVALRDASAPFVRAFGRGPAGDLYVLTSERAGVSGSTGACYRLVD